MSPVQNSYRHGGSAIEDFQSLIAGRAHRGRLLGEGEPLVLISSFHVSRSFIGVVYVPYLPRGECYQPYFLTYLQGPHCCNDDLVISQRRSLLRP